MQETPKTLSTSREGIPGGNTHWWKKKSKNLKDITMDNPQEIYRYICLALGGVNPRVKPPGGGLAMTT